MKTIHELIRELSSLGAVVTGHGPKHPEAPSDDLGAEIAAFLDEHGFLRRDEEYVDFLESYAGLLLTREHDFLSLSVYGFDPEIGLHLTEGEGDLLTEDGFLTFADATVSEQEGVFGPNDPLGVAFGFDATGERRPGVYRNLSGRPYEWYCEGFTEWLETLVRLRGRWI